MAEEPSRSSVFADSRERDDFGADRIRWLITLRWVAMAGVLAATGLVLAGYFPGVAWPVLLVVAAVGSIYNYFLLRRASGLGTGKKAAVSQALVDLVLLTVVLWAAGGISSPFIGFYVFHLALIGILGGPGATLVATAAAGEVWVGQPRACPCTVRDRERRQRPGRWIRSIKKGE